MRLQSREKEITKQGGGEHSREVEVKKQRGGDYKVGSRRLQLRDVEIRK